MCAAGESGQAPPLLHFLPPAELAFSPVAPPVRQSANFSLSPRRSGNAEHEGGRRGRSRSEFKVTRHQPALDRLGAVRLRAPGGGCTEKAQCLTVGGEYGRVRISPLRQLYSGLLHLMHIHGDARFPFPQVISSHAGFDDRRR